MDEPIPASDITVHDPPWPEARGPGGGGGNDGTGRPCSCAREEDRVSLVRALVGGAWLAGAVGVRLAAPVDRARGRRRRGRRRRRVLPRASLRAAARLPVPAARGRRRA